MQDLEYPDASLDDRLSWYFYLKLLDCLLTRPNYFSCFSNKLPFSELRP